LNLFPICDAIFQRRHRLANIVSGGLDVVRRRRAHVRMSQDSLNYHIGHTEAVQVASQSAPRRVPAVPLWDASITFVPMVSLVMI
jgi:hypothetical protein